MAEAVRIPVIVRVSLTPEVAEAGGRVLLSVTAEDVECVPAPLAIAAGEWTAGEV